MLFCPFPMWRFIKLGRMMSSSTGTHSTPRRAIIIPCRGWIPAGTKAASDAQGDPAHGREEHPHDGGQDGAAGFRHFTGIIRCGFAVGFPGAFRPGIVGVGGRRVSSSGSSGFSVVVKV